MNDKSRAGAAKRLLRRYEEWVRREDERGEPIASAVAALDFVPATLDAFVAMDPDGVGVGIARSLTAKSHASINSDPRKAAALALLAARIAESAPSPPDLVAGLDTARGEAWMRYAAALFEIGNFPKAWDASELADTYFQLAAPFPPAFSKRNDAGPHSGEDPALPR
jgi:hypothetical protein